MLYFLAGEHVHIRERPVPKIDSEKQENSADPMVEIPGGESGDHLHSGKYSAA